MRNTSAGKTGFDATPKSSREFIREYQQSIIITIGLIEFLPQIRISCTLRRLHVVLLNKDKDARRFLNTKMQKYLAFFLGEEIAQEKASRVRKRKVFTRSSELCWSGCKQGHALKILPMRDQHLLHNDVLLRCFHHWQIPVRSVLRVVNPDAMTPTLRVIDLLLWLPASLLPPTSASRFSSRQFLPRKPSSQITFYIPSISPK